MQRNHVTIRPLNREDSLLYFPPEAFGIFRVLHQIGAGALGPVFRAYEPASERRDRLVAIKVFRLDLTPEQSAALVAELHALIAAGMNHPAIAAPVAAGLEHGVPYLAQEYAVGDSLDVFVREHGPLPIAKVIALAESLAGAIDHAADRGIHHHLLHPRDILVADDAVRVTGFGIAAALDKIGAKRPSRPQYASPDAPSDIYSLGAIAFEAATGKRASTGNVKEFEAEHGFTFGATSAMVAIGAAGAKAAPKAAIAPIAQNATMVDPLDREIDLGAAPTLPRAVESSEPRTPIFHAAAAAPVEKPGFRWPIVAIFLGFAALAVGSVVMFLRSPVPTSSAENKPGVDSTIVDLPAETPPSPDAIAPKPAPAAPVTPKAPIAPKGNPAPKGPNATNAPNVGRLLIRSSPAGADVFVNGNLRGKTPLALREVALGSYTIRVARTGYADEERTLRLTARRPSTSTTVNLRAQTSDRSVLNVQSRPAGARVYVNDRLAGSTPISIPGLPAGPATVRIEMDGYLVWSTTAEISAGGQTRVAASLERK